MTTQKEHTIPLRRSRSPSPKTENFRIQAGLLTCASTYSVPSRTTATFRRIFVQW